MFSSEKVNSFRLLQLVVNNRLKASIHYYYTQHYILHIYKSFCHSISNFRIPLHRFSLVFCPFPDRTQLPLSLKHFGNHIIYCSFRFTQNFSSIIIFENHEKRCHSHHKSQPFQIHNPYEKTGIFGLNKI